MTVIECVERVVMERVRRDLGAFVVGCHHLLFDSQAVCSSGDAHAEIK